jgi:hypothetical protein
MASVALGIAAWGLMTSVSMIKSSLSLTEALLMGIFVVCRRLARLAAVPLIAAGGVMGDSGHRVLRQLRLSFQRAFAAHVMHLPVWRRLLGGYFTADLQAMYCSPALHAIG